MLESERVCGKHFVFGEPSPVWDQFHVDWVPILNLGKKIYVEKDFKQVAEKAERAKERRQQAIERAELEAAEKRKRLNASGLRIGEVNFNNSDEPCSSVFEASSTEHIEGQAGQDQAEASTEAVEFNPYLEASVATEAKSDIFTEINDQNITPFHDGSCQTEESGYMFHRRGYEAAKQDFLDSDDKVQFYNGLPSFEILTVVFEHVSPFVARRTLSLDRFQEFFMVLMKLRLNVPLQDLAYRFKVSQPTVSRIFSSWLVVMDNTLSPFVSWPEREHLLRTMPQCFMYSFGRKVTVVIDCFEIFIEKPTNLLPRAQTFSNYKNHNTIKILIGITPQGTICDPPYENMSY